MSDSSGRPAPAMPRAFVLGAWALLAIAAAAAAYLLYGFMMKTYGTEAFDSACNFSEKLNCDKLNTSSWGKLFGIPITVFALPAYLAMGVLAWMAGKGGEAGRGALRALALLSAVSVAYGLFLLVIMHFVEEVYCLFCMSMDVGAVGVLVLSVLALRREAGQGTADFGRALGIAAGVGLAALLPLLGAHGAWKSSLIAEQIAQAEGGEEPSEADPGEEPEESAGAAAEAAPRPTGSRKLPNNLWDVTIDADDASFGNPDARVKVVEFADFQCGYCKKLFYGLTPLKKKYEQDVQFVFKHYPMNTACNDNVKNDRHRYACAAAVASVCAQEQDLFWPMHDLLFKNQHRLDDQDLRAYAERAGADMPRFDACLKSPAAMKKVKGDIQQGKELELTGTPRTFINGRLFKGAIAGETLEHFIKKELGQVAAGEKPQPAARPAAADPKAADAAPAMTRVNTASGAFFIDTFEASVDKEGRALSLVGAVPANVNWYDAKAACEAAGKRLCTSEEWVSACQGAPAVDDDGNGNFADDYVEGNQFPYADWYEPGWCRDSLDRDGQAGPTGRSPRCVTPSGIYDLGGNLDEWTGATEEHGRLLGGHFYSGDKASCFRPKTTFGPGHRNKTMGFRCCADRMVDNPSSQAVVERAPEGFEGKPLPEFTGELMAGGELNSGDLKGQVVYLSFFASWCGPCRAEFDGLRRMTKKYEGKPFRVVAVGVDTDAKDSANFAKRHSNGEFDVILDPNNKILGLFDVTSMPTTYIIGKDGRVDTKKVGWGAKDDKSWNEVIPIIDRLL